MATRLALIISCDSQGEGEGWKQGWWDDPKWKEELKRELRIALPNGEPVFLPPGVNLEPYWFDDEGESDKEQFPDVDDEDDDGEVDLQAELR